MDYLIVVIILQTCSLLFECFKQIQRSSCTISSCCKMFIESKNVIANDKKEKDDAHEVV
jgi:hypothetical protein